MKKHPQPFLSTAQIRQAFLDYFAAKGHAIVASSPLVPGNDPTLLFTNAGMVQFKDVFLGEEHRPYTRAVSSQRCVRAGGKHNDLENVGYTARHHTFFEMLGNFSFGDYFKREAITYAWEFLTQTLHLPPERLWITVYKDDDEAADIWMKEIGIPADRLSRCGDKDNFWSMGDTGPCGPCTEIFYDHGPEIAGGPPGSPEADGDRYIEIWNLVFMQFNRDKAGTLHPLPKPSVDTGMGLERISAVMQGVHNNYDIDLFQHIIKAIIAMIPQVSPENPSLKVIADHCRSCCFLILDGVLPSNEGRGYVLRRILRRALRHGNKLGLPTPFFARLVQPLIDVMGDAYPALVEQRVMIERVITQEENQFSRTLEQGLRLLQAHLAEMSDRQITGDVAFNLYDTFGFPIDLTQDIAREQGLNLDLAGFEACMQQQRALSQSASQFAADYSKTEQLSEQSTFHGYEQESLEATVTAILVDQQKITSVTKGLRAVIILDQSPFYAESGGQVGDRGQLTFASGGLFRVDDTQKSGQAIMHIGELLQGELQIGQKVLAQIDVEKRSAIRLNHTATHLLHAALKQIVGSHVQQKGSLVDAERARFDFSHLEPLTTVELEALEACVNAQIRENDLVGTELMNVEEAKASGAMALFGEKYTEQVRVLTMGDFSKELCGGTHARRTGDIGLFKIVAEYGVSSGIRRIELVTGAYALAWVTHQLNTLNQSAELLKISPAQFYEKLSQTLSTLRQQEKLLAQLKEKIASHAGQDLLSDAIDVGGVKLLVKHVEGADTQALRTLLDQLKSKLDKGIIVLYAIKDDKLQVLVGITKSLVGQVASAGAIVKHLCGKGGGRDDMAQGGGDVPDNLAERLAQIQSVLGLA